MNRIYISKNSRYYFDKNDNLIHNKNGRETKWGKAFYTTKEDIQELLKEEKISIKKRGEIEGSLKEKLEKALDERRLDLHKTGGRFVALVGDGLMDSYTMYWSSAITKIEERDVSDTTGTEFLIDV